MFAHHVLLVAFTVVLSAGRQAQEDWDAKLEAMSKQADCVVLGRVSQIVSTTYADGQTIALGMIQVQRYFKGVSGTKSLEVELCFPGRNHEVPPDRDDSILFLRKRFGGNRYEIIYRWDKRSADRVREALARVDKHTRIPDMPTPPKTTDPIAVSFAADDGQGHRPPHLGWLRSQLGGPEGDGNRPPSHRKKQTRSANAAGIRSRRT